MAGSENLQRLQAAGASTVSDDEFPTDVGVMDELKQIIAAERTKLFNLYY